MTASLRLAVLAWPVEPGTGFAAKLEHWCARAVEAEAAMLLLPEYASCEEAFASAGGAAAERDAAVAAAPALFATMAAAASRHGLWLAGGTVLTRNEQGRIINTAPLFSPNGAMATQDKHTPTRFEHETWCLDRAALPGVFATPWGRIGLAVCYDVEFPPLVRAQVTAGTWLILVPACTDSTHGATRVTISARARAIENQCIVAVAPTIGAAPWCESLDANHGRAGIYGPADHGFPADGILAEGSMDEPGLILADLDPAMIAAVRAQGGVRNHADWPPEAIPACPVFDMTGPQ